MNPRPQTLAYAAPAETDSRLITRYLLVLAILLSGLMLVQHGLMRGISWHWFIHSEPVTAWNQLLYLPVEPLFGLGGLLVLVGAGRMLMTSASRGSWLLAAGLACQALAGVLWTVVRWHDAWVWHEDWVFSVQSIPPLLSAAPITAAMFLVLAIHAARLPASPWRATRLILIGAAVVSAIHIAEAALTFPVIHERSDPWLVGPAAFLRQRAIALGAGGVAAGIGIVAVLMSRGGSWLWLVVAGLTMQTLGLGIYWVGVGWLPEAVGPVTRMGASFETVSVSAWLLVNGTFVLLLTTALAVFFALPVVRGVMRSAPGAAPGPET